MSDDFFSPNQNPSTLFSWRNPLIGRGAGRQLLQIPFDDSIDGTHALECFFQMPTQVKGIRAAQIWVQSKPFRQYVSASSASSIAAAHKHGYTEATTATDQPSNASTGSNNTNLPDHSHMPGPTSGATPILANTTHTHTEAHNHIPSGGGAFIVYTGANPFTLVDNPAHNHAITTTLTPGIFETAVSGTLSLAVADDGVTYGANILSGVAVATGITKQTLLPNLTKSSGDKRVKITGTGLCRLQVLLVLDLRVSVLS